MVNSLQKNEDHFCEIFMYILTQKVECHRKWVSSGKSIQGEPSDVVFWKATAEYRINFIDAIFFSFVLEI